jgi:hypothetical protein
VTVELKEAGVLAARKEAAAVAVALQEDLWALSF